jgi:putative beta-barrel porin MtrB/PioB
MSSSSSDPARFAGTTLENPSLAPVRAQKYRPGELFGLHESTVRSWNVGANFHPTSSVAVGANYGRDKYGSLQMSRNANPPPDPTWTDPSRDWTLDNDDATSNFTVFVDLLRAIRNTDIRFGYDYSDSDNAFVHGGPRIAALTSIGQFIPLPNVSNTWHRATADVQYFFTSRAGVGLGYYFEKLDVSDFNTIDTNGPVGFTLATGDPRIDWLGALTLGYGNRPYTGHSVYARVLYRF